MPLTQLFCVIFGLSLPELTPYPTAYIKLVPQYLNSKMVEIGAEYLISRILTAEVISEVTQYNFDIPYLMVIPHPVKPPYQEDNLEGISGLKSIYNSFKVVNIIEGPEVKKIGSIAYLQY